MGLIAAALGAGSSVLADQYKEYFYCEALPVDVLVAKGVNRKTGKSTNKGTDNIITSGSIVTVADGQCMIIVDQGKIAELCAEPGEFTYDASTEPTVFCGNLKEGIKQSFENFAKRFEFGGAAPKDQRVYYINTREIIGNKYGTAAPVPFRVVDAKAGIDMDLGVRCFGEYSFRITDPVLFYKEIAGNIQDRYTRDQIDSQLKSELLTAMQPAFARISDQGIRYSQLPGHTKEIADALNEELSNQWRDGRGIEIMAFGISSVTMDEEDEKTIKEMQKAAGQAAVFSNASMAAGLNAQADATAKVEAAKNAGGAAIGFMGFNAAQAASGNTASLFQQAAQQPAPQPAPQQAASVVPMTGWTCGCGTVNNGKFCSNCGSPKPADSGEWTCECGATNSGKFCANCGKPRPAAAPTACPKCGKAFDDPSNPPKFCPECGEKI